MLCPVPFGSLAALRTGKMRRKLVRESRGYNTDRAATASLLYDVRSQPVGKAVEDGSLIN